MVLQKEAEPEIVGFSFVWNSERYEDSVWLGHHTVQMGPIYTKVSMTVHAIYALGSVY